MDKKVIPYFLNDCLKDPAFQDLIASSSNNMKAKC